VEQPEAQGRHEPDPALVRGAPGADDQQTSGIISSLKPTMTQPRANHTT
jgi:hypothetical protein